jgi:hypothetical protein
MAAPALESNIAVNHKFIISAHLGGALSVCLSVCLAVTAGSEKGPQ